MIHKPNNPEANAHRVITFLTRDEVDFLDKIGKDALFSAGTKLSRSKIISAVVDVMRKLNLDGRNLKSKRELEAKIMQAINDLGQLNSHNLKTKQQNKERQGGKNEQHI